MFAVSWLMPQMNEFCQKHPDIQISVQYMRMSDMIDPANVDVAVDYGNPGEFPDFVTMPLLERVVIPVASPNYLQRVRYKDLNDLPRLTLLHDEVRRGWRVWLERAAMDFNLNPTLADSGEVYMDGSLILAACVAGEGVALLPRSLVLHQLRAKTLIALSNIGMRGDKSYVVLTPSRRPVPRAAIILPSGCSLFRGR